LELHEVSPEKLAGKDIGFEPFTIVPVGDVQLLDPRIPEYSTWAKKAFVRHMSRIRDEHPNPFYIGMGDYIDFMSPSNRESFKHAKVYDSSRHWIEEGANILTDQFLELLEPFDTKGRWLGVLSGHHFAEFSDGTNTDQRIARELDAPYLGMCGHVSLRLRDDSSKTRGRINIWAHHGVGSRRYPSSKLVADVVPYWPEADLYLMGHMHESDAARINRMVIRGSEVVDHNALAVVCGGWLKGYVEGVDSYVSNAMLRPRAIGAPVIEVHPYRDNRDLFRREFKYVSMV
jgi:hypothetical protein